MTRGWRLRRLFSVQRLPANTKEWRAIAEGRSEWRSEASQAYSRRTPGLHCRSSNQVRFGIYKIILPNCKEISTNSTELRIDETSRTSLTGLNSNLYKPKWHRSQCCGQKWDCACVAQTKQVRYDSGGRGALAKFLGKFAKSEVFVGVAHSAEQ